MARQRSRARPSGALAALLLILPLAGQANDGAASLGAGGLVLRRERRVAMKRERLRLGLDRVRVEYEFVNESPADVATEVAFPIPEFGPDVHGGRPFGFHGLTDFTAWVDGRETPVQREARAFHEGKEVTRALRAAGVDLGAWLDELPRGTSRSLLRLPAARLAELERRGLLSVSDFEARGRRVRLAEAQWSVRITYHWTQRFPAGQVVRIAHEYTPLIGYAQDLDGRTFAAACPAPDLVRTLSGQRRAEGQGYRFGLVRWLDYVLTTARTWRGPIVEFELIVERPADALVSFCWDGPVEKVGDGTFRATARDFVPARELTVYYFQRPPPAGDHGPAPR